MIWTESVSAGLVIWVMLHNDPLLSSHVGNEKVRISISYREAREGEKSRLQLEARTAQDVSPIKNERDRISRGLRGCPQKGDYRRGKHPAHRGLWVTSGLRDAFQLLQDVTALGAAELQLETSTGDCMCV